MPIGLGLLCAVVALVLFAVATFPIATRYNIVAAGLAFLTLAFLLGFGPGG
jgi:hypothetical protein